MVIAGNRNSEEIEILFVISRTLPSLH